MSTIECVANGPSGTKTTIKNSYGEIFEVYTDYSKYSEEYPGNSDAATPWHTFLATIAACQTIHLMNFCKENNLDYTDLGVSIDIVESSEEWVIEKINTN